MTLVAVVLLQLVAARFAFRAIATSRTPQGSVAWVVFLFSAPYIAIPAFLFLGHSRYAAYEEARRTSRKALEGHVDLSSAASPGRERPAHREFERIADMPIRSGNDLELFVNGTDTFDAIFAAMDEARSYILIQFYIIKDDGIGREFKQRVMAHARRGISVRLLFDAVGCSNLPERYKADLREAGVDVRNVHEMRGPRSRLQVNFRNHRKTVIVDGQVAFIGGFNVGDEYLGRLERFGEWRDTQARLHGPVVSQMQFVFTEDWHFATRELIFSELDWTAEPAERNMDALIVATGPGDTMETGGLYFCAAIGEARRRLWIATPYFVPEREITTALKLAAMRGVDVRLLLPAKPDHRTPWLAAFAFFDEVMDAGVQIWRYDAGFMHQKVVLVDDSLVSVGTLNMDNRSCRLNFEATALYFDKRAAEEVAAMLEEDFSRSHLLDKKLAEQSLFVRLGAPAARLFSPLL